MTETPQLFGPHDTLVGILTEPAQSDSTTVAFLMFNAGVISRVGPHRLNVKLARALALVGQTSLRFDLSGRGDSRSATAEGDFRSQAVLDICAAMDWLEQTHHIRRFALFGICSGAVNAFDTALADDRVVGVLMFDGYWYRSHWTHVAGMWKRYRASSWSRIGSAVKRRLRALAAPATDQPSPGIFDGDATPPQAEFIRSVQVMVDRNVAVYVMYSGSIIEYYSYANQFRDVFGREAFFGKVRCDFRPDIDHTVISLKVQRQMIDSVLGWVGEVYGAGASTT